MSRPSHEFDLLIRAGRVVCPASGLDGPGCMAIRGDRIVAVDVPSQNDQTAATRCLDFPDGVLLPGLIDLHAHPAKSGSVFGVDPDKFMLQRGVTTVMSQGDAGAANIDQYIADTIHASSTQVRLAINLSRVGESTDAGCFEQLEHADVESCIAAIERHRMHIPAIAVNVSHHACGTSDPREILNRGLQVAERCGLPILYGMRRPEDWPLEQQLELLRRSDIVTYCFRRRPHCIVAGRRVLPCVKRARERGIRFDVGHGKGSFSFEVAEAALADGFPPDTISTDLQSGHMGQTPPHDLPWVMSKLQAAGMPDRDVFAAVTSTPARLLIGGEETGILKPGAKADLAVLGAHSGTLIDTRQSSRQGTIWKPQLTVLGGQVVREEKGET